MATEAFHVEAFVFVVILVIYVLASHIIENRNIPYLHESSIAIIMGILTAVFSKYVLQPLARPLTKKLTSAMNYFSHSFCLLSSSQPATASGSRSFFKTLV